MCSIHDLCENSCRRNFFGVLGTMKVKANVPADLYEKAMCASQIYTHMNTRQSYTTHIYAVLQ
jgi:hypothetical protein